MYMRHANEHYRQAMLHQQHAQAHHEQARFHQTRAEYHHQQAQFFANQPPYDERHTANANIVSPIALVYHGEISPESIQSLQQFYNPFAAQNTGQASVVPLSVHAAHATENQVAMQRGHKF